MNRALSELTTSTLREVVGEMTLDQVLSERVKVVKQAKGQVLANLPQGLHV